MYICRGLYNRERERECKQCSNVAKTIAVLSAKAKLVRKKKYSLIGKQHMAQLRASYRS